MKLSLVEVEATDHVLLPGLLYEPDRRSRHAAIWLHGNGDASIFYAVERMNAIGRELSARGIAFLPFNNRGAHLSRRLKVRGRKRKVPGGTTYERIREAHRDIDGAIAMLRSRGYRSFDLIGHSTGATKILSHLRRGSEPIRRAVLIGGGDDPGIYRQTLGRRFRPLLARAKRHSNDLDPAPVSGPFALSWRSLYDTIRPDGDYNAFPFLEMLDGRRFTTGKRPFGELLRASIPMRLVYGSEEEFLFGRNGEAFEILRDLTRRNRNLSLSIIPGARHGFDGFESELSMEIGRFLASRGRREE